jgi:hypothetical protein
MTALERFALKGGVVCLLPGASEANAWRESAWKRCGAGYRDQGFCATPSPTTFRLCTQLVGHEGDTHYAESPQGTLVEIWECPAVDFVDPTHEDHLEAISS